MCVCVCVCLYVSTPLSTRMTDVLCRTQARRRGRSSPALRRKRSGMSSSGPLRISKNAYAVSHTLSLSRTLTHTRGHNRHTLIHNGLSHTYKCRLTHTHAFRLTSGSPALIQGPHLHSHFQSRIRGPRPHPRQPGAVVRARESEIERKGDREIERDREVDVVFGCESLCQSPS